MFFEIIKNFDLFNENKPVLYYYDFTMLELKLFSIKYYQRFYQTKKNAKSFFIPKSKQNILDKVTDDKSLLHVTKNGILGMFLN